MLQSGRESALKLTQVVEMGEGQFSKKFPEYSQWKSWLNSEEQVSCCACLFWRGRGGGVGAAGDRVEEI